LIPGASPHRGFFMQGRTGQTSAANQGAMQTHPMIICESLRFGYEPDQPVLRDLRFHLAAGTLLGLVGANAAGKSTLLTLLAGLCQPTAGLLRIAGMDAMEHGRQIREQSALVPQEADLSIIGSTVGEDITLGLPAQYHARALDLAGRLALPGPDTPVHVLSHGQKRKLCLAAALLRRPRLLLLDEPFAGLDYPGMREIRAMLRTYRAEGLTQVVAVHDLEPLADLADVWLVLDRGGQAAFGPAIEVFPHLEQLDVRAPCSWRAGLGVLPWDCSASWPADRYAGEQA